MLCASLVVSIDCAMAYRKCKSSMNKFFLPTSKKFCPLFKHIAQLGSHFAHIVVRFAQLSSPGQEKGCFGVGLVFFLCM